MRMEQTYGYVRVSSRDQNEDRQMIALQNFGIAPEFICMDKQSGKDFNRKRQAEGIAAAKARCVHFGVKPMEYPKNFARLRAAWQNNEVSARTAAKKLGVCHQTFLRWASK